MKILFYRHSPDSQFDSIISAVSTIKYKVGYMSGDINQKQIYDFDPDVIIHNIPNVAKFPIEANAVSVNINETNEKNSFSLTNKNSKNYIGEFVHLKNTDIDSNETDKYSSDVVYIGSPGVFKSLLPYLINNTNFKFFSHQLHNIVGYCGICNTQEYLKYYKYAKVSIAMVTDSSRIMDIIISDGNPVLYDGNNADECISKIESSIKTGTKYIVDGYDKDNILSNHTCFDRAAQIFKTIGLNKVYEEILRNKKLHWCKK